MAGKISVKTTTAILLLCTVVLALYACIVPVDVQTFLKDEDVQGIIAKTKGTVKLFDSDTGLIEGYESVSGLDPNRYYKVEVIENKVPVETSFVKTDGTLSDDLINIGKVPGGKITGLTNDVTYRVKSAKPYAKLTSPNKIKFFALITPPDTPKEADITDGTVTIQENRDDCYFDVSTTIDAAKYYEVIKIRISGTGTETPWTKSYTSAYRKSGTGSITSPLDPNDYATLYQRFNTTLPIGIFQFDGKFTVTIPSFLTNPTKMSIMELPKLNTVNDYVFVEYYAPDPAKPTEVITRDFYVLKVNVSPAPTTGDGTITINPPNKPTDGTPTLTYNSSPIPDTGVTISYGSLATITITNSSGTYALYYDDYKPISTSPLSSTITLLGNNIYISSTTPSDTYRIIVERTETIEDKSVVYSTWFILKITP